MKTVSFTFTDHKPHTPPTPFIRLESVLIVIHYMRRDCIRCGFISLVCLITAHQKLTGLMKGGWVTDRQAGRQTDVEKEVLFHQQLFIHPLYFSSRLDRVVDMDVVLILNR